MYSKEISDLFVENGYGSTLVEDMNLLDMLLCGWKIIGIKTSLGETTIGTGIEFIELYLENSEKEKICMNLMPCMTDVGYHISVSVRRPQK